VWIRKLINGFLSTIENGFIRKEGGMVKDIDGITGIIVDSAYKLHKCLGPGLLESAYEAILEKDLQRSGLFIERQKPISFDYEGISFCDAFRVDLLVEKSIIVELKSTEVNSPVYSKQLLTYLKLMNLPIGLLINFGMATMKEGIHRVVNNYKASEGSPLRINQKGTGS
jgi:iron complex transport system substrate-binding protein